MKIINLHANGTPVRIIRNISPSPCAVCASANRKRFIPKVANNAILPENILDAVLDEVLLSKDLDRQRSLWAFSRVGRVWYYTAVSRLYRAPLLTARNFPGFARTICRPGEMSKPARRISLHTLVRHLDLGEVDTTSHVLARTLWELGSSITSFVSPDVNLHSGCLVALSSCTSLQELDLSRSRCLIVVRDVLAATSPLDHLTTLKMPRNAVESRDCQLYNLLPWPKNLSVLQIPSWLNWQKPYCVTATECWPPSLQTLKIPSPTNYKFLRSLLGCGTTAPHIRTLELGSSLDEDELLPIMHIMRFFPNLKNLTVLMDIAMLRAAVEERHETRVRDVWDEISLHHPLEELILVDSTADCKSWYSPGTLSQQKAGIARPYRWPYPYEDTNSRHDYLRMPGTKRGLALRKWVDTFKSLQKLFIYSCLLSWLDADFALNPFPKAALDAISVELERRHAHTSNPDDFGVWLDTHGMGTIEEDQVIRYSLAWEGRQWL